MIHICTYIYINIYVHLYSIYQRYILQKTKFFKKKCQKSYLQNIIMLLSDFIKIHKKLIAIIQKKTYFTINFSNIYNIFFNIHIVFNIYKCLTLNQLSIMKNIKIFPKKRKTTSNNMVGNHIKSFQKMKKRLVECRKQHYQIQKNKIASQIRTYYHFQLILVAEIAQLYSKYI